MQALDIRQSQGIPHGGIICQNLSLPCALGDHSGDCLSAGVSLLTFIRRLVLSSLSSIPRKLGGMYQKQTFVC